MKTLIITTAILFFQSILFSQNYIVASNNVDNDRISFTRNRTISNSSVLAYMSFTDEVNMDADFEYRDFLRDSKKSKKTYRIGTERYSKEELTKIFRKGARKSENSTDFETYLNAQNPKLVLSLSQNEIETLFQKFREGTFQAYLDSLPSVL